MKQPATKKFKVSKEVESLREQEQFVLTCYKEYLQVLEVFSKVKIAKLSKKTTDKSRSAAMYIHLRFKSIECFCKLLERHPHFNFRLNLLQMVTLKLSS